MSALAADRDPIGDAIDALNAGTASLADLLSSARPPLAGTVDQLNRLAPALDAKKDRVDTALQKAPGELPEAGPHRLLRQLRQLLHLLDLGTRLGSAGPDGGIPGIPAGGRKVRGELMLKYRGPQLVRAGLHRRRPDRSCRRWSGLSPERLVSWASAVRYQALFADVGGLAASATT